MLSRYTRALRCRRRLATAVSPDIISKYPIGLQIHGFNLQNVVPIPEFSMVAVQLQHQKTGLHHLHLDNPADPNNVFSVAFRTNPPDHTGVPHILEHTTLCGSYKYPVRDPFFKMLNRSLSNFMNAMTGHDYTFYPFATTNRKDFDNLMDVYLSSVFEPLLTFEDFLQEGWRLEQKDVGDENSNLEFKGVVYNEMKGQYSNASYLFYIKFQEAIYSALQNSGGDPAQITNLQYEDLVDFHAQNYHPSNAKTYTYGSFSLAEHLQKLNETYLKFGHRKIVPAIRPNYFEVHNNQSHKVSVSGPVDAMSTKAVEEQYKSSVTWYLGNALDESRRFELFQWKVLSSLLCDGHNGPFYQELIETGYGEDFTPNFGLDLTTSLLAFTVGLQNILQEKTAELPGKITAILAEKVIPELQNNSGAYHDRVNAILHQLELGLKKHRPEFGLSLLNSFVSSWVHDRNPVNQLQVNQILSRFKDEYAERGLSMFEDLLKSTLLNEQTPTFLFTMTPDPAFHDNLKADEASRLAEKTKSFDEKDRKFLHERSLKLAERQQQPEDVSVLPTLTLKDIPRTGEFHKLAFSAVANEGRTIQTRTTATNGLLYATALKDLSHIPQDYLRYLPLFTSCLTNLAGTSITPITELEIKIQQLTGGVSFGVSARSDPHDIFKPKVLFSASGMALQGNSEHIFSLWQEILLSTKFSPTDDLVVDKLAILIKNLSQNQLDMISDRGHSYANAYSNAQLTPTKYISNLFGGFAQVELVQELNNNLETRGKEYLREELLPILEKIRQLVLFGSVDGLLGFKYNLVGETDGIASGEKLIGKFDEQLRAEFGTHKYDNHLESLVKNFRPAEPSRTILSFPFQVGFASLAKTGSAYASKDGAALQVLSQLMTFKHLHSAIRESNGAYGGGLNYDGLGGTLNYYSYRDPNAIESIKTFEQSYGAARDHLENGLWTTSDLAEAKLAIFQSVDAPSHISSQGQALFTEGITNEMKQQRREWFLDVGLNDLKEVNEKYLGPSSSSSVCTVVGDAHGADSLWTKIST